MTRKRPGLPAILEHLKQGPERSSLFWWLHEHHDELMAASAGRRIRWEPMVETFADLGLSDRTGKSASATSARQTWLRVRKLVARAAESGAAQPRVPVRVSVEAETNQPRKRRHRASIFRILRTPAGCCGRNSDDIT